MELRLYSFVNYYLSSIQQGIQTGHAAVDLVRKYDINKVINDKRSKEERLRQYEMVTDWADHHKTFIILNGGDFKSIGAIGLLLQEREFNFPYAFFNESFDALNGLTTCVAVVLPENIFNAKIRAPLTPTDTLKVYEYINPITAQITSYYPSHDHYQLIELLKSSRLAV